MISGRAKYNPKLRNVGLLTSTVCAISTDAKAGHRKVSRSRVMLTDSSRARLTILPRYPVAVWKSSKVILGFRFDLWITSKRLDGKSSMSRSLGPETYIRIFRDPLVGVLLTLQTIDSGDMVSDV